MSQKNIIKERKCLHCRTTFELTAKQLKAHAEKCKEKHATEKN